MLPTPFREGEPMHLTVAEPPTSSEPELLVERGYELIDGQRVEKPMGAESSLLAGALVELLRAHVRVHGLGRVFPSECGYQIFPEDPRKVRKPDVSFIAHGRLPDGRAPRGNVRVAPDLAVEVVSPKDLAEEIEARVVDYLAAGTRLMWVLYPGARSVWVVRPDGRAARLTGEQELSGEDVVPGFACKVQDLFAELEPS
jgi:Uma2 family endonuclease